MHNSFTKIKIWREVNKVVTITYIVMCIIS